MKWVLLVGKGANTPWKEAGGGGEIVTVVIRYGLCEEGKRVWNRLTVWRRQTVHLSLQLSVSASYICTCVLI